MKTFSKILLMVCLLSLVAGKARAQGEGRGENVFTLMSYNVHNGVGTDGKRSVERIAQLIRRHAPEVVAIQEVDSVTGRSGGRYVLGELAAEALYQPVFAPAIDFNGGKYGVGLLCKEKPLSVHRVPLPGREERRVMLVAEFPRYRVACVHLSLTEADRMASLCLIREEAARSEKPFILAGDWNDVPASPFVEAMTGDFLLLNNPEQLTFPAGNPNRCIDYIALYKPSAGNLQPKSALVIAEPTASDHRPLLTTLEY